MVDSAEAETEAGVVDAGAGVGEEDSKGVVVVAGDDANRTPSPLPYHNNPE